MSSPQRVGVSVAVEGVVDEAVVERLADDAGLAVSAVYGKSGKAAILNALPGYNNAARGWPWVVLLDLDDDPECAPAAVAGWLPDPAKHMSLRVAVREIEAWLLADRSAFARFLGLKPEDVPADPETLDDPKGTVVALARRSKRRAVRTDIVPRPGSGRKIGPGYTSRMMEFIETVWSPSAASEGADSLRRCRKRLAEIGGSLGNGGVTEGGTGR